MATEMTMEVSLRQAYARLAMAVVERALLDLSPAIYDYKSKKERRQRTNEAREHRASAAYFFESGDYRRWVGMYDGDCGRVYGAYEGLRKRSCRG